MYDPLIKAFNCALDRLSKVNIDGLPEFKKERQIVFARNDAKCIGAEAHLQGSYKPDIILIKWRKSKTEYEYEDHSYLETYISDICCKPGRNEPPLSWRNILSTVEVKHGDSEGKGKVRSVKLPYNGGFTNIQGDEMVGSSKHPQSAPQKIIVDEEYPTHRCVSIAPLFSSHSHQVQFGHALAREVKVSHFRLRIGRFDPERGAENCTKPTEPTRRGPGAMEPQSLVGSAIRERS